VKDLLTVGRIMARCRADGDCLVWQGARLPKGYGQIRINRVTKQTHRALWTAIHGEPDESMMVMHTCDNPPCCNPAHLRLGTADDNAADMVAKGRSADTRNERSGKAKLTNVQIAEIRRLRGDGVSCTELGRRYDIHPSHVSRIVNEHRRPPESTHYEGCWLVHHDCAIAEINRLRARRHDG
jgi:hypothetical protein